MEYWTVDSFGNKCILPNRIQLQVIETMKNVDKNELEIRRQLIMEYGNSVEQLLDEMEQLAVHSDEWKITPITNKWKQTIGKNDIGIKAINGNSLLEGL